MKNPNKVASTINLEKVLLDYSYLATVLLAANGGILAQSCMSPSTMIDNNTIMLDIDGDGTVDFALVNSTDPYSFSTKSNILPYTGTCPPSGVYAYSKFTFFSSYSIKNLNFVIPYNSNRWMKLNNASAFPHTVSLGGIISGGKPFGPQGPGDSGLLRRYVTTSLLSKVDCSGSTCNGPKTCESILFSDLNNFSYRSFNGGSKYLGVEFTIGANIHYGWLELNIPDGGTTLELISYCYNPTPGASIQAGMMAVLPVEIASYSVRAMENSIQINWATASEVNHEGFEIQRSVDGLHFSTIASQPSAHNSNEINNYEYTDLEIEYNQRYYYRLKSIDQDGTVEYGNVESAMVEFSGFTIGEPYPNPVLQASALQIPISGNASGEVNVTIFDTKGSLLMKQSFSQQEGSKELSINMDGLRAGMYIVSIAHLGDVVYKKIIID